MSRFPLWGLIFVALAELAVAKKNDHQNIEKVEIELDVLRGDAKITYNEEWKSHAEVLYAQKKKIVAYKDKENEWCLLEKIERRGSINEERFSRQFKIVNKPLEKDQLEKLAGKRILTFCEKHTSIILKPYSRGGLRRKLKREERVKRDVYSLRGNETQISHQEASKKLLEGLTNVQSLSSSRASHGKSLKRNVEGKTDNLREHYPSSSAKVAHAPGIDYHAHIRNNIFPGSHAGAHPIDITSSVTITTGSSHKIWSYPPSSGGYHNITASTHPSNTPNLPHSLYQNTSRDISPHGVQHSLSHHPYPSSLDQNQGHYSPSASSKSQQSPGIYPPSSTSKTQAPAHYPPSSVSKNHQGPTYYHPPSATSKSEQTHGYFPPSSTSKTQSVAHYPPSSTSKTQSVAHYPPSSTSKTQGVAHYPPSSTSKTQGVAHYPPSSASKTQGVAHYPPSSTSKTQGVAHYPPSSTSKTQGVAHYPPSSASKTQGAAHYPPSATNKTHRPSEYFPPSSSTKTQPPSYYVPSSAPKYQPSFGHYPPSSYSKTQGPAAYHPSATSKSQPIPAYYPPSSSSKPQQGETLYSLSSGTKQQDHKYYPPSSVSKPQYHPSGTDKTHHTPTIGHYPPSSESKPLHGQYPPSSTSKTHPLQQNITTGNQAGGERQYSSTATKFPSPAQYSPSGSQSHGHSHFAASHHEPPSYVPPSSTSKIHHPQNGTHFQYNNLYSYGAAPGIYAPQFPPSSTSKLNPPQQFPPSGSNLNYLHQNGNNGHHHPKFPHSPAQYPPSSTAKFHTKLDQSGGQTPHYPPSSTTKTGFPLSMHGSTAPVLEKPSAQGSPHEHPSYPTSSSAKEHPARGDIPQYTPSSTSKTYYVPSSGHTYGGPHQSHSHPSLSEPPSTPPSGSPPSVQIPQPPVSGHFHSSLHIHGLPAQYYPPSASVKQSHHIPHSQNGQPITYYPSSTAKLHPTTEQNATKHLPSGYFPPSSTSKLQPSSAGHHHDFHPGAATPAHIPYYPPSAHSKSTLNQGTHSHHPHHPQSSQHHPHYPPSSSWHHMRNESSTGQGKSLPPSSVGYTFYPQPQYPPSSSSRLHPNSSQNIYPSPAMPQHPSGAQHYPAYSPYNLTISHHHQYQHQPNIPPQSHDKPHSQQGSTKPCQGSTYSVTTRTIVTPNGVIQRPVSVKNNGESPCGNARQGSLPYAIPCGSIIKNGQTIKVQSPCMSNHMNQRKSMQNVLVPGPALVPGKRVTEQNEFGGSEGVVITNVGESEAEVLDGVGYPVSQQQFSHLKENSTFEEVEDLEAEDNGTKIAEAGEKEKVEEIKEETSAKGEEEEVEVKEGDVLEPGDRILGKNGYTISDGFRGRVVSVSGQVGKTRTTKAEKKTNSAHFKYSLELGRYSKDDQEKRFSDCHGEVTFTCSEFLGSNGRAKICKPNPRRNPDGSPC